MIISNARIHRWGKDKSYLKKLQISGCNVCENRKISASPRLKNSNIVPNSPMNNRRWIFDKNQASLYWRNCSIFTNILETTASTSQRFIPDLTFRLPRLNIYEKSVSELYEQTNRSTFRSRFSEIPNFFQRYEYSCIMEYTWWKLIFRRCIIAKTSMKWFNKTQIFFTYCIG